MPVMTPNEAKKAREDAIQERYEHLLEHINDTIRRGGTSICAGQFHATTVGRVVEEMRAAGWKVWATPSDSGDILHFTEWAEGESPHAETPVKERTRKPTGTLRDFWSPLVCRMEELPGGHLRIETALTYPDGAHVDVFVDGDKLTDLGQTMSWLLGAAVKPDPLFLSFGAEQEGGALVLDSEGPESVIRLAHACVVAAAVALEKSVTEAGSFSKLP